MPKLKLGMSPEAVTRALRSGPDPRVVTYREHRCQRVHRTHRAMAHCIWPNAVIDNGEGPFALVWWLNQWPTITLCDTADDALDALSWGERTYSPQRTLRHHKVVRLELPTNRSTT